MKSLRSLDWNPNEMNFYRAQSEYLFQVTYSKELIDVDFPEERVVVELILSDLDAFIEELEPRLVFMLLSLLLNEERNVLVSLLQVLLNEVLLVS